MLDDLKEAWHQAVENFWRELRAEDEGPDGQLRTMQHQVASARHEERRLDAELARCENLRDAELREVEVCRRREAMAAEIGDEETVQVARRFAARHREKADVLESKRRAFEAERELLRKDIAEMERALSEFRATHNVSAGAEATTASLEEDRSSADFERLRQSQRERAAEERLEELKRKMR